LKVKQSSPRPAVAQLVLVGCQTRAMLTALKHFAIVGLGFALILGWLATLVVNRALGGAAEAILREPPEKYYIGSALLTVVSISLIALCIFFGNRVFRRRLAPAPLPFSSLLISTGLFFVVVLAFVLPQLSQVLRQYADNTRYFYHHSSGATPDALASVRAVSFASGGVFRDFEVSTSWNAKDLTNRWSQPLAVELRKLRVER
jgi:hypothetical protein